MDRKHFLNAGAAWAGGLMLWPLQAVAQQRFPQRAVRIVVPYAAGGNLDLTTRLFAQHLSEEFGQPFVVENRPGANGNTGTEQVVRTAPDGYTLAMVSAGTLSINPALYRNMPFEPEKDLTHISIVSTGPMVLLVTRVPGREDYAHVVATPVPPARRSWRRRSWRSSDPTSASATAAATTRMTCRQGLLLPPVRGR